MTRSNPELVYLACTDWKNNNYDSLRFKLWSLENGNWVKKIEMPNTGNMGNCGDFGYYKMRLLISPGNPNIIYVGGNTFDRFQNWNHAHHTAYETSSLGYHPDTRDAKIFRTGNNDIIFAGNDGGISKTLNGTESWSNLNGDGLVITHG